MISEAKNIQQTTPYIGLDQIYIGNVKFFISLLLALVPLYPLYLLFNETRFPYLDLFTKPNRSPSSSHGVTLSPLQLMPSYVSTLISIPSPASTPSYMPQNSQSPAPSSEQLPLPGMRPFLVPHLKFPLLNLSLFPLILLNLTTP